MSAASDSPPSPSAEPSIYNRVFWLSYVANACGVAANSLTFRFADFVNYLRGSEQLAGLIVSVGVMLAIACRFFLGPLMDRYGVKPVWLISSLVFIASCCLFSQQSTLSPMLFVLRVLFAVGLAGMFSASIVHIQNQAPAHRRTEIIGSLGSSGFIGMISGPALGDLIFRLSNQPEVRFRAMFLCAAALGGAYLVLAYLITRGHEHTEPEISPPTHSLLRRYWPGPVMVVAMTMGLGLTVISVFLTRFAAHLGLKYISTFYTGYALAAFTFRIGSRNLPELIGRHRMVLIGLAALALGTSMLLGVKEDWHLLGPAILSGMGHALLFPAVVSLGAGKFPQVYRGTGTTVILGCIELGTVIMSPILGTILDAYHGDGFPQMFLTATGLIVLCAVFYACTAARQGDADPVHEVQPVPPAPTRLAA